MIKEPYKSKAARTKLVTVRQARYENVDTGRKRIIEEIDENGVVTKREEAIQDRVYRPPIQNEEDYYIDVWIVETDRGSGIEKHEFANQEDAIRYYRGA